ncbi:MAG: hypothetical protein E7258_05805 [Lachnospiraceae bacterium]|nr:hypothetical protein [Lachnospiraceae bacterium]
MNKLLRGIKKILISGLVLVLVLSLSGCSADSEKNIIKHAKDKYGPNKHIKTEELGEDKTTCYFTDNEYGFEYYVSSYMNEIIIDGSSFGSVENKGSNFDIQYYNYLCNTLSYDLQAIEEKYNVDIEISDGTYIYYFAQVYYKTEDSSNASSVTKEISDLYTSLDTRHYWKNLDVEAYDCNGEYLGAYHYEQTKWMTPEDEVELDFILRIEDLSSEAEYLRKEQHKFTETGVDIKEVVTVLGSPEVTIDSMVTYYIFTIDGKEYFMTDFMIINDIGGYEYYTTYKQNN